MLKPVIHGISESAGLARKECKTTTDQLLWFESFCPLPNSCLNLIPNATELTDGDFRK
jgi:hypothetical protein